MIRAGLTDIAKAIGSLFFPAHCAGCGCRVEDPETLCTRCAVDVSRIVQPRCEQCSQPYSGVAPAFQCPNCRGEVYHFVCAVSVAKSRGVIRDMVHRLKYGRELWLGRVMAELLEEGLADERLKGVSFDALVPVPLHPKRQREREFNQSDILAKELSRRCQVPLRQLLERRRYTTTQTALDRRGRRQNLREAFVLRKNTDVTDLNLLLVDDVLTTGSTLDACAAALVEAGAASVHAITVARG